LIAAAHNANYGRFSNIQNWYYWSTQAAWGIDYTWAFGFDNCGGCVDAEADKTGNLYVWPVHSGNVVETPPPSAIWLFISALLGMALLQ